MTKMMMSKEVAAVSNEYKIETPLWDGDLGCYMSKAFQEYLDRALVWVFDIDIDAPRVLDVYKIPYRRCKKIIYNIFRAFGRIPDKVLLDLSTELAQIEEEMDDPDEEYVNTSMIVEAIFGDRYEGDPEDEWSLMIDDPSIRKAIERLLKVVDRSELGVEGFVELCTK